MGVRLRGFWLDAVLLLVLGVLGWVHTSGIQSFVDIGLYDESGYLHGGISIRTAGIPGPQSAPLYALWYHVLSLFSSDTVALYYLNFKVVTVALALMFFLWLRVNDVPSAFAYCCSIGVLVAGANFSTWPKVSHFAVLVLLAGFIVGSTLNDDRRAAAVISISALLASYVRPEFSLGFVLLVGILALLSARAMVHAHSFKPGILPASVLMAALVMVGCLGFPVGGNRSMVAFGQHYAINWVNWHNDQRNPWTNFDTIVRADFGEVSSPFAALLANPRAVGHHVLENIRHLPNAVNAMVSQSYPHSQPNNTALILGLGLLLFTGIVLTNRGAVARVSSRIRQNGRRFRTVGALVLVTLLPVIVSILVIAPRLHYLVVLWVLLGGAGVVLLFRNADDSTELRFPVLAALLLIPLATMRPLSTFQRTVQQPVVKTVQLLRSLGITAEVHVLEAEGGYGIYVGRNYERVDEYSKKEPFDSFLAKRSINMIVVSGGLRKDTRFEKDPEWTAFVEDPSRRGFTTLEIPDVSDRYILVRSDILESARTARPIGG